jgi:hypothetical protein
MNTGQMMLTAFALVLLSVTILTVNRTNLQQGTILRQTDVGVYAISLATGYVQKASSLDFDEYTISNAITNGTTTNLTAPTALGVDSLTAGPYGNERANVDSTFDDFDDFNNFFKTDTVKGADLFTTRAKVYYVDTTGGAIASGVKTFFKRMDLKTYGTVSRNAFEGGSANGVDTIKMVYIYSYINRIL